MKPFLARPYQGPMIQHIQDTPRCGLFVPMGAGKTPSTLAALLSLALVEDVFPALVVAPMRVARKTWTDELAKWLEFSGLRAAVMVGTPAERKTALATKAEIYCINYENLPWLREELGKAWPFRTVVTDEMSKLKNFRGSVQTHPKSGTRFLRVDEGLRSGALAKVAFKSARFIGLTGTPCANGLQNLWAPAWFLDQGHRLGATFGAFAQRWFRPHPSGYGIEPLAHAQDEIQCLLKDVCLTIDLKDWMDVRDPVQVTVAVELPKAAMGAYRKMEKEMFLEIQGHAIESANAAAKTMRCLQLANGAIYTDESGSKWAVTHDAKLEALASIREEAEGMPLLVAYQFKSDLARLKKAFPDGRELATRKDEDDFKAGRIPMLFAHPESAGHGIDGFQHATNICVFFGHWWDLELRQQFIERIGPTRQMQAGYDRPVFVYDIVAQDTIDEVVQERHRTKATVQELLLAALKRRKQ